MKKVIRCIAAILTLILYASPDVIARNTAPKTASSPTSRMESMIFCGFMPSEDYTYYNLLAQEIIGSPRYFPFLVSYDDWFYETDTELAEKNENIEEWAKYLEIPYDQAYYLVFQSARTDLRNLAKGIAITDPKLNFANEAFVTRHKQSLLYLAYAKYLEPYMSVESTSSYNWNGAQKNSR